MSETVLTEGPENGILHVSINRPSRMNAIDLTTCSQLRAVFKDAALRDEVRCVVFSGQGDEAFSAGYDIHEMADFDRITMIASIVERDPLIWEVANHPKTIICAINGIAHGAGALLAAASDMRIGGPAMNFRVTATRYGSANATWTLPAVVGTAKAKEILLTGRAVEANEAEQIGLINYLVAEECVLDKAFELAAEVSANPASGPISVKALINGGFGLSLQAQYQAEQIMMIAAPSRDKGGDIFEDFIRDRETEDESSEV